MHQKNLKPQLCVLLHGGGCHYELVVRVSEQKKYPSYLLSSVTNQPKKKKKIKIFTKNAFLREDRLRLFFFLFDDDKLTKTQFLIFKISECTEYDDKPKCLIYSRRLEFVFVTTTKG